MPYAIGKSSALYATSFDDINATTSYWHGNTTAEVKRASKQASVVGC